MENRAGRMPSSTTSARASVVIMTAFAAVLVGGALGAWCRVGDHLAEPLSSLANMGWPWLIVAFMIGAMSRRPLAGAVLGAMALLVAVGTYYLAMWSVDYGMSSSDIKSIGVPDFARFWLVLALLAGPVFGAAGGLWRTSIGWIRPASVALLSGALLGETGADIVIPLRYAEAAHLLAVVIAVGLPLVLVTGIQRLQAIAWLVVFGVAGVVAMLVLVQIVRSTGP